MCPHLYCFELIGIPYHVTLNHWARVESSGQNVQNSVSEDHLT